MTEIEYSVCMLAFDGCKQEIIAQKLNANALSIMKFVNQHQKDFYKEENAAKSVLVKKKGKYF